MMFLFVHLLANYIDVRHFPIDNTKIQNQSDIIMHQHTWTIIVQVCKSILENVCVIMTCIGAYTR